MRGTPMLPATAENAQTRRCRYCRGCGEMIIWRKVWNDMKQRCGYGGKHTQHHTFAGTMPSTGAEAIPQPRTTIT